MRRARALAIAVSLTTLALCGCGGGGGDQSASTTPTETQASSPTQASTAEAKQPKQGQKQERPAAQGKEGGKAKKQPAKPKPARVKVTLPPISSAPVEGSKQPAPGVKTTKGADNSVQGYGVESSESDLKEAALALQGYLDARLEENWERACSYISQKLKAEFEQLVAKAQSQGKQIEGCAGVMTFVNQKVPASALREGARIEKALSFRVEGDVPTEPSFLLFLGPPESTLYSMPMYLEGGDWKVGLTLPSALPV